MTLKLSQQQSTHDVEAIATTIDIAFSNKEIVSFKTWGEFEEFDFQTINHSTKSIYMQWDFMLNIPSYPMPQRHTVSVRITAAPLPSDMFKVLLSGGFDEAHDFDIQSSTMICKVDFINNTLASELVNIAANWNDLCENAYSEKGVLKKFVFKSRMLLAKCFEISSELTMCAIIAIICKYYILSSNYVADNNFVLYAILFSCPLFAFIKNLGSYLGRSLFEKLSDIMDIHIFNISCGDQKTIEKISKNSNCKKEILIFVVNLVASILLS